MQEIMLKVFPFLITATAFVFGAIKLFQKKKPLYFQILVCAAGCFALSQLSDVITYFCGGFDYSYSIGMLGIFGCNFFLLSANYGQLDRIVDDGSKENKPAKITALIAPVIVAGFVAAVFTTWKDRELLTAVLWVVMMCPSLISSYFNLKHIIMPMDDFGFLKATKLSNFAAMLFYVVTAAKAICSALDTGLLSDIPNLVMSVSILAIVYAAVRGAKQWAI